MARDTEERSREHTRAHARLAARLEAAQEASATLAGTGARPGLAELAERSLDDDGRALPLLGVLAESTTEDEAHAVLPAIEMIAREASALAAPHPLAARGDWKDRSGVELARISRSLRALRDVLRELDDLPPGGLPPAEAAARSALWAETAVLLDPLEARDAKAAGEPPPGTWPSWPSLLAPQHHTEPALSRTHAVGPPYPNAIFFTTTLRLGTSVGGSTENPSRPLGSCAHS